MEFYCFILVILWVKCKNWKIVKLNCNWTISLVDIVVEDKRDRGGGGKGNPNFFLKSWIYIYFLILKNFIQKKSYIYMSWVQVIPNVTLNSVTLSNNLLLNSYFKNPTIELHVLYVLNMFANFHANQMLFTTWDSQNMNSKTNYWVV